MNEPFTRFPSHFNREERTNTPSNQGIGLTPRDNRSSEAFFAEALHQIDRETLVDWESFESEHHPNPPANRSCFPYRLKLLASAAASCEKLPSDRIERQLCSAMAQLAREPRPSHSVEFSFKLENSDWQPRQIELDAWRVLYAINEGAREAIIVAIAPSESNLFNLYLSSQETYLLNDRAHHLGSWEYHYC